jgi:hypothetical protein
MTGYAFGGITVRSATTGFKTTFIEIDDCFIGILMIF